MANSSSDSGRPGEFELIARLFAPLATAPGAFGLTDDAALATPPPSVDLVVTADALVEGVHFLPDDPPDAIAKKALRVNLSDLAAKGCAPAGYLLVLALPDRIDIAWLTAFAKGLGKDQAAYQLSLLGGDTTSTPGPLTIAITAFGHVPTGTMIRRAGAKIGDLVFVSATIGDAGAGLACLKGEGGSLNANDREFLIRRYRLPEPRVALGRSLRGIASAALDVSDGLLGDLEHIGEVSQVGIEVRADTIPLSRAARSLLGSDALVRAATSGDDYEIAFTAPPSKAGEVRAVAAASGIAVTEIGRVVAGQGVVLLDSQGREVPVPRKGFTHF